MGYNLVTDRRTDIEIIGFCFTLWVRNPKNMKNLLDIYLGNKKKKHLI